MNPDVHFVRMSCAHLLLEYIEIFPSIAHALSNINYFTPSGESLNQVRYVAKL